MEIKIKDFESLEDFKKEYHNIVGNTPPQDIQIIVEKPDYNFLEFIGNELTKQIENLGLEIEDKDLQISKKEIDYTPVKIESIFLPKYGYVNFLR